MSPIPPDVLLVPSLIGGRKKIYLFAFICSLGPIFIVYFGHLLSQFIWRGQFGELFQFALLFFQHVPGLDLESFNYTEVLYEKYDFLIIFTSGFTPIPFKIFTFSSGAFGISFSMFVIASLISRNSKFFLLAFIVKFYGDTIITFIDKYFNLLSMIFTILLICGLFTFKVIF